MIFHIFTCRYHALQLENEGDMGGSEHRNTAEKINEHRITARKVNETPSPQHLLR